MDKQEEFPIGMRIVDAIHNRVAYKHLDIDEFLKISAIINPIAWIDIPGGNMKASCCYNKECPQRVNNKCIAGYKDNSCKNRKASFNGLDYIQSKQIFNFNR